MKRIIRDVLLREEGMALNPYTCPAGFRTIGVGHNMEASPLPEIMQEIVDRELPITETMAFDLLDLDIELCIEAAGKMQWFHLLSDNRKAVVVTMIFQLGITGFKNFKKAIKAMEVGDYEEAAAQMLSSKWAKHDSPERAKRMALMMALG